ncbi:HAMP domain-containing sensor histidine kinase [Acinetobacter bereziniae]|uniref:sensor histidine kinase n=1 Tax=Acinetobacter bereziniae TaxID=106648 RepID=UPI000573A138|nr:HAMP domain-containing sensor histidine kinase [Acinetobacter bereziniae]MDQ9820578.1 HAMP domain-containing sensor histidine kinase [Acinetobacter bereziniae]CEI50739.1 Sensory histidine kinase QseC [Acinetobacter bereziniae]
MSQAISLQHKLIKTSMLSSIVAGLFALLLLIALSIYHNMDVQDQIMDEISDMLLISDLSTTSGFQLDELSDEFDIQYQLMNGDKLLTQSREFELDISSQAKITDQDSAYDFIWSNHQIWRSYHAKNPDSGLSVYVIQPLSERFKDLSQSLISYFLILLSLWAIQWLILHFSVKKQFRSIQLLSTEIAEKNVNDLSLIQQPQPEFKELQPMVNQLNQMFIRLEQALVAEQRFTADASHELRSPLSAIHMRLQLLQRKYAEVPEIRHQLSLIQNDVFRGTQVLENLLLLARLDPTDKSDLPKTWVSLEKMTHGVLSALETFIDEKQVQLHIQSEDANVDVNEELMFICIRNLIDNAIRYTPQQGNIYIDLGHFEGWKLFEIQNDGEGVSEEVIARLGERFFRALGTQTQGSGLGLSICKTVVDLHQGKIDFSASKYGGLKIRLYLP